MLIASQRPFLGTERGFNIKTVVGYGKLKKRHNMNSFQKWFNDIERLKYYSCSGDVATPERFWTWRFYTEEEYRILIKDYPRSIKVLRLMTPHAKEMAKMFACNLSNFKVLN